MIDPQQLERRPNCVVGLSSQCCSRHAGKNGLLCAVLLLGSLAHLVLEMLQYPHVLLTFDKVHNPLCLPRKTTLQRPKVARTCGAL